jgi:hypothetical protein
VGKLVQERLVCRRAAVLLLALLLGLTAAVLSPASGGTATQVALGQEAPRLPIGAQLGTFKGRGSKVLTVRLPRSGPLVVTTSHNGSANFVVRLVGKGLSELLVNEIGSYVGQVAVAEAPNGRYRIPVQADGAWVLALTRPVGGPRAKAVPATFKGRGSRVIQVRAIEDLQPIIRGRHRGQANFIVQFIGYGSLSGSILLFNEIGNFAGETLVDDMPQGPYLLAVQADGPWTLRVLR